MGDFIRNLSDTLNEWVRPVREWLFANHGNPLLWFGLFLGGLALFFFTYKALHKD